MFGISGRKTCLLIIAMSVSGIIPLQTFFLLNYIHKYMYTYTLSYFCWGLKYTKLTVRAPNKPKIGDMPKLKVTSKKRVK